MKNYIFMLIVLGFIAFACNRERVGQQPIDNVCPGPISNVKFENTAGGAIFTYTLPQDEDLLYVKAVFSLKDGVLSEVRSSLYSDTLKIAGFGDTQERQVKLIAVDRSRNESPEVLVTITPLQPAVITIGTTLNLIEDFGGVYGYWDNPTRAEVSVVILKEDNNKEYVPITTVYSTMAKGEGVKRGMDTLSANFGIYVQDRWENRSEIKYFTLTPIYETKIDRLKFKAVYLPDDNPSKCIYASFRLENAFDGNISSMFCTSTTCMIWPQAFTIDLGVTAKLSRLILYQRAAQTLYFDQGSVKKFEVWGCQTLDATGNWASWTKLSDFIAIKPSGLPNGQLTAEDIASAIAGGEFIFPPMIPKVRYVRFNVTENWAGFGALITIGELVFFGDNRVF